MRTADVQLKIIYTRRVLVRELTDWINVCVVCTWELLMKLIKIDLRKYCGQIRNQSIFINQECASGI